MTWTLLDDGSASPLLMRNCHVMVELDNRASAFRVLLSASAADIDACAAGEQLLIQGGVGADPNKPFSDVWAYDLQNGALGARRYCLDHTTVRVSAGGWQEIVTLDSDSVLAESAVCHGAVMYQDTVCVLTFMPPFFWLEASFFTQTRRLVPVSACDRPWSVSGDHAALHTWLARHHHLADRLGCRLPV